jgi:aminoglycoside 3-N-acetyltransferase
MNTYSQLMRDFRALGVAAGQTLMLHASVKAFGSLMGGPNIIIQALLDIVGSDGTLMMYAGWNDIPDFLDELSPELRALYLAEHPPFDPNLSRSVRDHGILVECLRTWTGSQRSLNPEASMVAVGKQARFLTANHALHYGYGAESPLAKLVALQGHILLLGSPLDRITLLHHAEYLAQLRHKQVVHYRCPISQDGKTVWVEIEDYDTSEPHDDYTFEQIARAYRAAHPSPTGKVGGANCHLFDAAALTAFAVEWLEMRFGSTHGE